MKPNYPRVRASLIADFLVLSFLLTSTAIAQTPGTFTLTGNMTAPGFNVPSAPDPWLQAITAMKTAAGTDSFNFWQWAWYWQRSPTFPGTPVGFGVLGSIDNIPGMIDKIVTAGGGNGFQLVSAEQWVLYYRQATQSSDPWLQAITAMKTAAGTDSFNFWQWAWYWQRSPTFPGAPVGFGVLGSIDNIPGMIDKIVTAGGGNAFQIVSAEQWVLYYRSSSTAVSGVVNAASHLAGAIGPGELVVVTGSGLGPAQVVSAAPDSDGLYPAQLAGTTVLVNGTPVPLIYTSATQVAAVVPDSVAVGTAQITVTYQGQTSASFPVPVARAAPGIFTVGSTGQGHAASINQNGLVNTAAQWGDVITLFVTGVGHATPAFVTISPGLPWQMVIPISGGDAQGTAAGVMQIKVPIQFGLDCDVPVVVQVGDASSQASVTIPMDICI
jgi:uncharacterized protein (TIGR03437 family)